MSVFFEWLDAHPPSYWVIAWTSLTLCGLSAWLPKPETEGPGWRRWASHPAVFASLVFLTLCAFRWPSWFEPKELNPDESQIIAGAITLRDNPVFWKSVDGTTHGPLNEYILTAASLVGVPLNYLGARLMAALLIAGALLCAWGTLRELLPERSARLGILPGLAFWCFSWLGDFLHFSSELVALALLSAASWAAIAALRSSTARPWVLSLSGASLALVPLAKLQATPLALGMGLGCLVALVWKRAAGWRTYLLGLCGGALAVAALLGLYLVVYGLESQFWYSYVVSNLSYADSRHHPLVEMPNFFFEFMTTGQSFAWFFYGCLSFALLQAKSTWREANPFMRHVLVAAWIAVAGAYFCVVAPGREVPHYLQLLVIPVTVLTGLYLPAAGTGFRGHWGTYALFLLLGLVPQIQNRVLAAQLQLGHLAEYAANPISDAGRFIRERQKPGQCLAVWGWNAQLHIETGLPQGTREAHSAFQLIHGPLREFYRNRYLRDMTSRLPEWFVDAVGPKRFAFEHRSIDGHETFPELDRLIRERYVMVAELDSMRIYRLAP